MNPRATEEQERLEDYIEQFNDLVQDADIHVRQTANQQVFCNEKINEGIVDASNGKLHNDCTRTIVVDYSQNVQVPQLGSDQLGKTYYYSPLRVFIFEIVDFASLEVN